jgi:hypothetical protein
MWLWCVGSRLSPPWSRVWFLFAQDGAPGAVSGLMAPHRWLGRPGFEKTRGRSEGQQHHGYGAGRGHDGCSGGDGEMGRPETG